MVTELILAAGESTFFIFWPIFVPSTVLLALQVCAVSAILAPWLARLSRGLRVLAAAAVASALILQCFFVLLFTFTWFIPYVVPLWVGAFVGTLAAGKISPQVRLTARRQIARWVPLLALPLVVGLLFKPTVILSVGLLTGQRDLRIVAVKWDRAGPSFIDDRHGWLTAQDELRLESLRLAGTLRPEGGCAESGLGLPVTIYVVAREDLQQGEQVEFPLPFLGYVAYVQSDEGWEAFPPGVPTLRSGVLLYGGEAGPGIFFPCYTDLEPAGGAPGQ